MKRFFLFATLAIAAILNATQSNAQYWKELGPILFPTNQSGQINGIGRVTQLVFHPSNPTIRYATSASGGLYKTIDTGHNWTRLGTDKLPLINLASICIDYTNDQIIYLGSGDPNYYSSDLGLYKSIDGGQTFTLSNSGMGNLFATDLLMDPSDHLVVVASTNNGIWRTNNGGTSWVSVKAGNPFTKMERIPNTNILLAVTANTVWRSADFGQTWNQIINSDFVQSNADGMRIATNSLDSNIVYVLSNGGNGVVFKSVDKGQSFSKIYSSNTQCLVCYDEDPLNPGQGDYNFAACGDPLDPNHLYIAAQCLWESIDGGLSWERKTRWSEELHTDHHQFSFDPYDNTKFWSVNDGGVWLREGLNDSLWKPMSDGISATEIYKAANGTLDPYLISIGTQDNGEKYSSKLGWFTNRGGDWTSRVLFDYSAAQNVYYLNDGERRSFNPTAVSNSFNMPFAPTNNARIAFTPNNLQWSLLGKDTLFFSTNLQDPVPTWKNIFNTTTSIRDIVFSAAQANTAYALNISKFITIQQLNGTVVTNSVNLPASAGGRGAVATVKADSNIIYISTNSKMWRSADKGTTWTDITYNLPTSQIIKIYHDDYSTNETVYICSGNRIFAKTKADIQWTEITYNLPTISNVTDFMLYNDSTIASKLRVSYYGRGTWEYALHPNYPPVAKFKASNNLVCVGQSIAFQNLSVDDSLTYSWSFPGGTPSTSTAADPVIVYNTNGTYDVTLTATNKNGSNVKTESQLIEVVTNYPAVDSTQVGNALYLNGSSISYANMGPMDLNTNELTMMAWVKPQGAQNDWGGIVFCRGGSSTSGMSIKNDNEFRLHWDGDFWWESTGLYLDTNKWNHVAMAVTPTAIRMYVNGQEFILSGNFNVEKFDADMVIGADFAGGDRRFKGWIDEVAIYKKALSKDQIREQMHLIKRNDIAADAMVGYWQMNEKAGSTLVANKAGCKNQAILNSATMLVKSTAPFGPGISSRFNVNAPGVYGVNGDLELTFPAGGLVPNGEIVVTHIRTNPDEAPTTTGNFPTNYWTIDNYGANKNISPIKAINLLKAGHISGAAAEYDLFERGTNADGPTWSSNLGTASSVVNGANGTIKFSNINPGISTLGQLVSSGLFFPLSLENFDEAAIVKTLQDQNTIATIVPNPADNYFKIINATHASIKMKLFNAYGAVVLETIVENASKEISCANLPSGIYFYKIQSGDRTISGQFEIKH